MTKIGMHDRNDNRRWENENGWKGRLKKKKKKKITLGCLLRGVWGLFVQSLLWKGGRPPKQKITKEKIGKEKGLKGKAKKKKKKKKRVQKAVCWVLCTYFFFRMCWVSIVKGCGGWRFLKTCSGPKRRVREGFKKKTMTVLDTVSVLKKKLSDDSEFWYAMLVWPREHGFRRWALWEGFNKKKVRQVSLRYFFFEGVELGWRKLVCMFAMTIEDG